MTEIRYPTDALEEHSGDHPADVVETAKRIAMLDEAWVSGKKPEGIAAAALYLAYRIERPTASPWDKGTATQSSLAEEFDTSTVTVRKRRKHLAELVDALESGS